MTAPVSPSAPAPASSTAPVCCEPDATASSSGALPARRLERMNLNPGGRTQYMNMGFWTADTHTLDAAGEAMARMVAARADLRAGDRVLDVGCGSGEADFLWQALYGVERLVAIDRDADHIDGARQRAAEAQVSGGLEFRQGDATCLEFGAGGFDTVLCVEAAHGFTTREMFVAEAFRVLRPGGVLVMTDILPRPGVHVQHFALLPENAYPRDELAAKLTQAGFVSVTVDSIREHVIDPFNRHLARLAPSRSLLGRYRMFRRRRLSARLDYVLATARRPFPG